MIDFKTDVPTDARRLKGAIGLAPRAGAAVEIHQRHFRERLQVHPLAAGQRMLRRHQRHQRLIGQLPVRHRQQIGIARPDADERHIAFCWRTSSSSASLMPTYRRIFTAG